MLHTCTFHHTRLPTDYRYTHKRILMLQILSFWKICTRILAYLYNIRILLETTLMTFNLFISNLSNLPLGEHKLTLVDYDQDKQAEFFQSKILIISSIFFSSA